MKRILISENLPDDAGYFLQHLHLMLDRLQDHIVKEHFSVMEDGKTPAMFCELFAMITVGCQVHRSVNQSIETFRELGAEIRQTFIDCDDVEALRKLDEWQEAFQKVFKAKLPPPDLSESGIFEF
jgi:hypothetical protein